MMNGYSVRDELESVTLIPALVKSNVGSSAGTSELEVTTSYCLAAKKSRNAWRISAVVFNISVPSGQNR